MTVLTAVAPSGQVGAAYSWAIDLDGDFELTGFSAPDGLTVKRVGRSIVTTGTPIAAVSGFDWRVGIKSCCCNIQQSVKADLTITL
jgi:hypothetical protein